MRQDALKPESSGGREASSDRLDSWKDIAAYLKRDVSTVQRWEKRESMPIHRHLHDKLGSVYAFPSELDAWWRNRRAQAQPRRGASAKVLLPDTDRPASATLHVDDASAAVKSEYPASKPHIIEHWSLPFRVTTVLVAVALVGTLGHALWMVEVSSEPDTSVAVGAPHSAERSRIVSVDPAADQEYRVGRYYLWRYDEENLRRAIEHFERAIQIDPACAAAFAAMSNAWWARGIFGQVGRTAAEFSARHAAERALALDDRLAAAYVAQADVKRLYDRDSVGAEEMYRRALALDPNSVEGHHSYALLLMSLGRFPDALAHIARAAVLDPLAPAIQSNFGRILYRARRFKEAIPRLQRALELEPGMRKHFARLGEAYEQLGQYSRALEAYGRAGSSEAAHQARVARILARIGRREEARQLMEMLAADPDQVPLFDGAGAYAALGDTTQASKLLATLIDRQDPGQMYIAVDPQFASLHALPQWPALLQRATLSIEK
jgi:tetratricopeptide (TPR) repeat protein